jgi:hypothetical protein
VYRVYVLCGCDVWCYNSGFESVFMFGAFGDLGYVWVVDVRCLCSVLGC